MYFGQSLIAAAQKILLQMQFGKALGINPTGKLALCGKLTPKLRRSVEQAQMSGLYGKFGCGERAIALQTL